MLKYGDQNDEYQYCEDHRGNIQAQRYPAEHNRSILHTYIQVYINII